MPRVGMMGNRSVPARGDRPHLQLSTQSAEIRSLARQLSLLQDSGIAEHALKDAIEQTPLFKKLCKDDGKLLQKKIETTLYRWRKRGILDQKTFAVRMAQAVESALSAVLTKKPNTKSKLKKSASGGGKRSSGRIRESLDATEHIMNPPQTDLSTHTFSKRTNDIALVSDSEGMTRQSSKEGGTDTFDVDMQLVITDFWPNLIEAIGVQVASRTTSALGKKKVYEMYKLAGPCMPISDQQELRHDIAREFLKVFDESHPSTRLNGQSECRVFSVQQEKPAALWIQINIGRPFDVRDRSFQGLKKNTDGNEFIAMIVPESNLVALTASRAASRSVYTPYIIFVLETVLTCSVAGGYASAGALTRPMHNLSGTEPFDLLRTASAIEASDAVGRYANYASQGKTTDPITDLQQAANESVLFSNEKKRCGDRHISNLSAVISQQSKQQTDLVAATEHSVCWDQNAGEKKSRKRMRVGELGDNGDCPVRQSVKWDWKGSTDVEAWGEGNNETNNTTFKCRLSLKGSDVFAGMQALLDCGILEGPLPHYISDAPLLGGKIVVDHSVVKTARNEN